MVDSTDDYFEHVVEASETFNEHISSLVSELVASSNEEVESAINVEIKMPAKDKHSTFNQVGWNSLLLLRLLKKGRNDLEERCVTRRNGLEQTR